MLCSIVGIYKLGSKANEGYKDNKLMVDGLYEAYAITNRTIRLDTTALRVLCVGNSIAHHAPLRGDLPGADSLWRGDWGMCASRPEMDFVHQLESMCRQYNPGTAVTRKNLWEWENNLDSNLDSLMGTICQDKDVVILKIGENVKKQNECRFQTAFGELVDYCLKFTPNVIVAGSYWEAPRKESAMIRAARERRLPYVPLFWIYETYHDEVIAHVGDTIYDRNMQPYPIASEFICTHPNDKGMRMIAESIFAVMQFN